uniref:Uncharacterized protein n=1 Tax=Rhizophora mucronata TaxID=61149 RepID=A0A2P2Q076_RHIMU
MTLTWFDCCFWNKEKHSFDCKMFVDKIVKSCTLCQ